jgi:hypothetical protein
MKLVEVIQPTPDVISIAKFFERRPRCVEQLHRTTQFARDERNLGVSDDTPRAGHGLLRPESTCGASQKFTGAREIAELCHRNAA